MFLPLSPPLPLPFATFRSQLSVELPIQNVSPTPPFSFLPLLFFSSFFFFFNINPAYRLQDSSYRPKFVRDATKSARATFIVRVNKYCI